MPTPEKILLVHNYYSQRGGEDVVFEQETKLLKQKGHEVVCYTQQNFNKNLPSFPQLLHLARNFLWSKKAQSEIRNLLNNLEPDLVHVHNTFITITPSIFPICHSIPVVQTLHNFRPFCINAAFFRKGAPCEECIQQPLSGIRHACYHNSRLASMAVTLMNKYHNWPQIWKNRVNLLIVPSSFVKNKLVELGLPASQVVVKPHFVTPDPGTSGQSGKFALYLGRISKEKGIEVLIGAWKTLTPSIPLHLAGDGPMMPSIQEFINSSQPTNFNLVGRIPREMAMQLIAECQVLIFPSLCYEQFGMTIIEAFACGKPVICSRLGTMGEIVADGQTGLHFEPGNSSDLAAKVRWAWDHPEEIKAMGMKARREFEAKYQAESNYQQLLQIYRMAIEGKRLQPSR